MVCVVVFPIDLSNNFPLCCQSLDFSSVPFRVVVIWGYSRLLIGIDLRNPKIYCIDFFVAISLDLFGDLGSSLLGFGFRVCSEGFLRNDNLTWLYQCFGVWLIYNLRFCIDVCLLWIHRLYRF